MKKDLPGWRDVALAEVCHEITVGHVGPMASEYVDEGIPFLRSQNIRPFHLALEDIKFISSGFHRRLKKSALKPGDVVVVRTGYPGTSCVIPKLLHQCNCADLVIIRPSFQLDPWFLSCVFNSVWGRGVVAGNLVGAAQQHFNIGAAKQLRIALPPLNTQRRIASILSAYDDLIENNTRRIAILEDMARLIYQEWFVRFRFPGHESVRMVESELGPIPEGWEVKPCSEVVEINPRTRVPKEGLKPFVSMAGLSESSMLIDQIVMKEGNSGAKFKNGDTLFARITPCLENGKTGLVRFLPDDETVAFGSTEFIVMRAKTVCAEYVYLLARSEPLREHAIKSMSGASGRQRVREACFDTFFVPEPAQEIVFKFHQVIEPLFDHVQVLAKKNANLRTQRDLLLPKLISGEIDVSKMEVEELEDYAA